MFDILNNPLGVGLYFGEGRHSPPTPTLKFEVKITGADENFALPLTASGTYDFTVDWGDGSSDDINAYDASAVTHTYASAGTHNVKITGTIIDWKFDGSASASKIYELSSWGPLALVSNDAFRLCTHLTITATDHPDTSGSVSFLYNFRGCTLLESIPNISRWATENVTSMTGLFYECPSFDQDLGGLKIPVLNVATLFLAGLSTPNYDATLIGWQAQTHYIIVTAAFGTSKYTPGGAAESARAALVAEGWTITDGGAV